MLFLDVSRNAVQDLVNRPEYNLIVLAGTSVQGYFSSAKRDITRMTLWER